MLLKTILWAKKEQWNVFTLSRNNQQDSLGQSGRISSGIITFSPCIPPIFGFRDLSAKSKFLVVTFRHLSLDSALMEHPSLEPQRRQSMQ